MEALLRPGLRRNLPGSSATRAQPTASSPKPSRPSRAASTSLTRSSGPPTTSPTSLRTRSRTRRSSSATPHREDGLATPRRPARPQAHHRRRAARLHARQRRHRRTHATQGEIGHEMPPVQGPRLRRAMGRARPHRQGRTERAVPQVRPGEPPPLLRAIPLASIYKPTREDEGGKRINYQPLANRLQGRERQPKHRQGIQATRPPPRPRPATSNAASSASRPACRLRARESEPSNPSTTQHRRIHGRPRAPRVNALRTSTSQGMQEDPQPRSASSLNWKSLS